MSIKFTKRVASEILSRGVGALKINPNSLEDAKKAITRDDVRKMIKEGGIFAVKTKSEKYPQPKTEKRKKGIGKRKGRANARRGRTWERKIRSQRILLAKLKEIERLDNETFRRYYLLAKGGAFPDKRSLLLHLSDDGINVTEEELKKINDYVKSLHK